MIEMPGPLSPDEALEYFGITQRPPRTIERLNQPELHPEDGRLGWKHGDGGWGSRRLPGTEQDSQCDYDQYYAEDISAEVIFSYMARSAPVMIRGLIDDWPMVAASTAEALKRDHGDREILVSNVPYAEKFGTSPSRCHYSISIKLIMY
jgi:hypothetical protein